MAEEFARSNTGTDNVHQMPVDKAQQADFYMQALSEAYGPRASGTCCDRTNGSRNSNTIDFSPAGRTSLAEAFGNMLAAAGYDKLFSAQAERDPQDRREDRRKERDEKREQRREKLKNLFETIKGGDLGNLDLNSLVDKLKLAPEMIEKAKSVAQALQGVDSVKFKRTDDGKLGVTITRKEENQIDINKEQPGPPKVTVKNATVGKELSFKLGKDGDNYKLEDIQGIKINSTVELPKLLGGNKDVSVDLKSATLDKDKDGKSVIKAEVTNPLVPGRTMPVVVPLSMDQKK